MNAKILAIDLGVKKSVCGVQSTPGAEMWRTTVATTKQALHDLMVQSQPELVVVEACSLAFWVHDLASALGIRCVVAATNGEPWKWKGRRNKSDRTDVDKLMGLARTEQLQAVHVPAPQVREWRTAIRHRHRLVRQRTRARNEARSLLRERGLPMPTAKTPWTKKWTKELEAHAKPLEKCSAEETWRGVMAQQLERLRHLDAQIDAMERTLARLGKDHAAVAELEQVTGVGPRTTEVVVATIVDPLRFRRGRQVGCYAGLTPRRWQSGETEREGRISREGDALLRAMLVEASWLMIRHEGWARQMFERVRKGTPKRSKIAIVAVARRLLIRLWARWRDWELARREPSRPAAAAAATA